jgi:CheY-like chemotaxis protein
MPGTELAALIEERFPDLPDLVLTGWGEQTRERVRSANVRAVLAKPATAETLYRAVAEALAANSRR